MTKASLALTVFALAFSAGASAAEAKKPVPLWLCSDYLEVDEVMQPTVLGFAEALNRRGKPEAEVLDVQGIAKVKPELVTYCRENPKVELRDALTRIWDKIK
ncbi:acid-resistance protein [Achromobacter xylosoxidans]|uniref:acid-activated periplasmic chaperone HdeA n=1 Tax=Achromobacter insolitus TaxID=217204 RepID=UPI0007C754F6|nr:acid-activated periplasmic chaperone HdeA [Achromobacter insolitus]OCZ66884.1 acid-resistance protein [Achromobacter xylosoxidans]OAE61651.1 acid-resistance protein [Achromobacter insolitus]OCZ57897.1 acid-resistance protein [Achromobacter insolitus]OCZ68585.1 acid-resistance protein [Achromobacter xylosoxidans]ODA14038.1 acid-resistance protein [Achromobacter xylosoxidans]